MLQELGQERQYENSTTAEFTTHKAIFNPVPTTPNEDVITLNEANLNVIDHHNNLDFSSDDSVADPSFVPHSDITNLRPLSPDNIRLVSRKRNGKNIKEI